MPPVGLERAGSLGKCCNNTHVVGDPGSEGVNSDVLGSWSEAVESDPRLKTIFVCWESLAEPVKDELVLRATAAAGPTT